LGLALLGVFGYLGTGKACAQVYQGQWGGYSRSGPPLSPYLDLTRGGNPAVNYFLGVLPEIDRRKTKVEQGTAIFDLERRTDALGAQLQTEEVTQLTGGGLPPTGHAAAFTTYGSYYGLMPPYTPLTRNASGQRRGR
jgi:hypothetical protein